MNNNNLHKIFNSSDCISSDKMIEYQEGKLTEIEKNSIEKHLASCSMCQDEFEGLQLIQNKSQISHTVFELNSQVDSILANTNKKIPFLMPINLMAAIILFIIGFAWYATYYIHSVTRMKNEQVTQSVYRGSNDRGEIIIIRPKSELSTSEENLKPGNEVTFVDKERELNRKKSEFKTTESDDIVSKEKIIVSEEVNLSENKTEKDEITENSKNVSGESTKKDDGRVVTSDVVNNDLKDDKKLNAENEDLALSDEERNKASSSGNQRSNKSKKESAMTNTVRIDNFDNAMADYNKRDYRSAIELFKQSLSEHPKKDEVYFYLAMSYQNIDSNQDALANYNKVIAYEQSNLYEQALWNKSQLLLKMDKKKSAVNSLNQLKKYNGDYSKKAQSALDSLNNN